MSVQRSDRLVIRSDGSVERAWSVEESGPKPEEAERLGDRFEELLKEDEPQPSDRRTVLAELSRQAANLRTSSDQLGKDRAKDTSTTPRPTDQNVDPSAEAAARDALQSKGRKREDGQRGSDSGGGGSADTSGALMAAQAEGNPSPSTASGPKPTSEPTGKRMISELASEVATRIATTHDHGSSQVQIDLREDVLPQTSMTVENQAGVVVVTVASSSKESTSLVSDHAQELGQEISRRTGSATRIHLGDRTWTTEDAQSSSTRDGSTDGSDAR